jgi:hypothetical protein
VGCPTASARTELRTASAHAVARTELRTASAHAVARTVAIAVARTVAELRIAVAAAELRFLAVTILIVGLECSPCSKSPAAG